MHGIFTSYYEYESTMILSWKISSIWYLEKLCEDNIKTIKKQHPTLTRDEILEWHKEFLNAQ